MREWTELLFEDGSEQCYWDAPEIASDDDPSIMTDPESIQDNSAEEIDFEPDIELLENHQHETLVSEFGVDTTRAREHLGWRVDHSVEESIRE